MKAKKTRPAFSLVETVVALGIFAFCITILLGVFPIGMRATRSVANDANAVHISSSIFAIWQASPSGTRVFNPGVFGANSLTPTVGNAGSTSAFFTDDGTLSSSPASMQMTYTAAAIPNFPGTFRVDLDFVWPITSSPNTRQNRTFSEVFNK